MGTWKEDIITALKNLGGIARYDDLYSEIEKLRTNLPDSWKAIVQRRIQDLSSDSAGFKGGEDLFFSVEGLGAGVWGLRSKLAGTPKTCDLSIGVVEPEKVCTLTYRILRDTPLARKIKVLHADRCQLCGNTVQITPDKTYSEAHHIIPLGSPHNGPDVPENIVVLCPNHHVLCDYGAIQLDSPKIRTVKGHVISDASIKYHNTKIYGREL